MKINPAYDGKTRVNRMFERREQDRVPRHESFWQETITRWQGEGLAGAYQDVLDMLGSDFQGISWIWPQCFPGREEEISRDAETRIVRDGQGKLVRYWLKKSGTPEHLGFDCDSREKWERVYRPALLASGNQVNFEDVARSYRLGREQGRWCHLNGVESFEETRSLMGDEITLMAMVEDPEWLQDVSRTFTDVVLQNLEAIMATGIEPDGLFIYGDMAFNSATMCSPQMYKELFWPDHKRLADWAHARGMKMIYHTDGDVNGVVDLYIEAGFDCLQPLEVKASMDIRKLCPRYGRDLAFFGNVDVMKMITNDLDIIEEEIAGKLAAGKATHGYVYHSDHSVPPQVSWATYQHIIRLLDKYGAY